MYMLATAAIVVGAAITCLAILRGPVSRARSDSVLPTAIQIVNGVDSSIPDQPSHQGSVLSPAQLSSDLGHFDKAIDLTTRHDVPATALEPPGYGLYSYLLFGSSSSAGRGKRLAASRAYCTDLEPVSDALAAGHPPRRINVLLVFTKSLPLGTDTCRDPVALADTYYNYGKAQTILREVGIEGDGIYLVATKAPVLASGKVDRSTTLIVDLSTVDTKLIEASILEFRRQTRRSEYWKTTSPRALMFALRKKLPDIAEFIQFARAAAAEHP